MTLKRVNELLISHFAEASDALVDKAPSDLRRGEGTNRPFYILKVDLAGSTRLLLGKRHATYLKLAHTFLSTVDQITQDFGADDRQVEYVGDGLFAYFPATAGAAERVLQAAFYAKSAVNMMANLGGAVGELRPKCRIVIHYDTLTVAKIGPRAGSILSAIGWPIHKVAKLEGTISPGVGRATIEYRTQLNQANRKYLNAVYVEDRVLIPTPPPPVSFSFNSDPNSNTLAGLYGIGLPTQRTGLLNLRDGAFGTQPNTLASLSINSAAPIPQAYRLEKRVVGYDVNWTLLAQVLR